MKPRLSFLTTTEGFVISQDKYQPGWIMPYIHRHTYLEIYILEYGERIVTINDKEYSVSAYQATFFPSNIPHKSKGTSAFGGICISFEESYINRYLTKTALRELLKCFEQPIAILTEDEFAKIKEISDSFIPFKKNNYIKLINLLDILNTACRRIQPQDIATLPNDTESKSQLIFKYIDDNYRTIKSSEEVCELFNVSQSYFFKCFKSKHGISPRQYINNLKLRNACQLLIYRHDRNAKKISADCGFESYEYFMRLFKKKLGCTPIEYRNTYMEKTE